MGVARCCWANRGLALAVNLNSSLSCHEPASPSRSCKDPLFREKHLCLHKSVSCQASLPAFGGFIYPLLCNTTQDSTILSFISLPFSPRRKTLVVGDCKMRNCPRHEAR